MDAGKAKALYAEARVKNRLAICHRLQRPLFEMCPDLINADHLTELEVELWALFYDDSNYFPKAKR